ncbi:hypothetical protein K474DRAFT_1676500 [Panus rudis PR-1116 ss-1]|nr:hypothetical protein K474DRAFT_1676500 [Panus rudis PR-1116 ss-1]
MENDSTFVAPEGVYSVTEEHKPSLLGLHANNATPHLHPTRLTAVTIKFPAAKGTNNQVLSQLLGGGNRDKEKDGNKKESKASGSKERDDGLSASSSESPEDPLPGSPDISVSPVPDNSVLSSPTLVNHESHTIFSHSPAGLGKKKTIARPKHNMRTTSSTFITRLQNIDNLNKVLQSKQGESTFLFYNTAKTFIWTEAGSKPKEPLARIFFSAYPTCHDVNLATLCSERIDVIIGFNTGDLLWFDPLSSRYGRLNKQGRICNSPCTAVRWVPNSPNLFLVSHADGTILVYDKEREDGIFTPNEPTAPSSTPFDGSPPNTTPVPPGGSPPGEWNPLDSIFVTMPPWHPVTTSQAQTDFVFSPDVKYVAAISEDGCLRVIDAIAEQLLCFLLWGANVCSLVSGWSIYTGGQDDLVTIYSPWEQRVVARCQGHSSFVSSVAFDDIRCDGRTYRFGSVGEDNKLILLSDEEGNRLCIWPTWGLLAESRLSRDTIPRLREMKLQLSNQSCNSKVQALKLKLSERSTTVAAFVVHNLEIDVRQLILSDLAENIEEYNEDPSNPEFLSAIESVTSKVETRAVPAAGENSEDTDVDEQGEDQQRVFMANSTVHCNIGFSELAVSLPHAHVEATVPVLVDILRDIPYIDFDQCLAWDEWALPDQLVFKTVSALLRISTIHPEHRESATGAIIRFTERIVHMLQTGESSQILSQFAPAFHGFYRAIISIPFPWSLKEWTALSSHLNELFAPSAVERLNRLLIDVLNASVEDPEKLHFIQTLLARYISRGRPLSGYFIVCCVTEAQWTTLAQALTPSDLDEEYPDFVEAAAANRAWQSLLNHSVKEYDAPGSDDDKYRSIVRLTIDNATKCLSNLLVQIEQMDTEPSEDSYAWETMSESLKLSAICSVALGELDQKLYGRLKLLLSDESPISDNLVQEAALKATAIIVRKWATLVCIHNGRIYELTLPQLPGYGFAYGGPFATFYHISTPNLRIRVRVRNQNAAIPSRSREMPRSLAPGDDIATSKEGYESGALLTALGEAGDRSTVHSVETGLRGLTEDEKRLVGISTMSVVTRLALEFRSEDVIRLTISMLLQRMRSAEPTVEAAIAYNLVDLALAAPESAFVDIIRSFSNINRSANPDDPRFSNNMVLAAQTRLSRELYRRPELYEIYLVELLTLFADKGVAIQNVAISNHHAKVEDMTEQLASLLLPIDALLSHEDFHVDVDASPNLVSLFRNIWFTVQEERNQKDHAAMGWQKPALARIAIKTPPIVLERAHDSIVGDLEYNPVIRQEYAETIINKHRGLLQKYIPLRATEIRGLFPGQIVFLLAMHDVESMRSAAGLPSSLVSYFTNNSLNNNIGLVHCMEAVAEKVIRGSLIDLNSQASQQALPTELSQELRSLLVGSTHRIARARDIASKYLNRLVTSFPSLMCDPPFVIAILEVLTLLRQACENEFTNEDDPTYIFRSETAKITLQVTDDYGARKQMLAQMQRDANTWFELALGRAPVELHSTLQKYLALNQVSSPSDSSDLGSSIALHFGKAIGPIDRKLSSVATMLTADIDRSKSFVSQMASKGYFVGEIAGYDLAKSIGLREPEAHAPQPDTPDEVQKLKERMAGHIRDIREKKSGLTIQNLKRVLFRASAVLIASSKCDYTLIHYLVSLPFESFTPSTISAGIEVWTWVIAEKPEYEVAFVSEITTAWINTIKHGRGMFSQSLSDPLSHPIEYSPSDRDAVNRSAAHATRLLSPHNLILQLLVSRLQAARYRKPSMMLLMQRLALVSARAHKRISTHPLSREARFSFLLFGFETLRSSHLDTGSENELRQSLYEAALSWFSVRPQWSYGANRVQLDVDIKLLNEVLSFLQADAVRGTFTISSLITQGTKATQYTAALKALNLPLRLLVDNEITRLMVWTNPCNDQKRGLDHFSTLDKTLTESSWKSVVRKTWQIDPAVAVFLSERFNIPTVHNEVSTLVRSNTREAIDVPEALRFLVGDMLQTNIRRDLKYLVVWAPVPPILAITFFEKRYRNDPLLLQYAHRVLEGHPVDLTFFFVPQVVQALRHDDFGYVARFIFETAKISQLFCHQIIWNMKANCYKDDSAEVEDPLKPTLDKMVDLLVDSLSGEAKGFYEREFGFFHEVTSISGKLKPYIKKPKPEKKAKIDEEMAKIRVEVGVYLPSNPDGKVVDIDKKSGRPLQSHAKAPFMATFKVRKERQIRDTGDTELMNEDGISQVQTEEYDVWQQAIFKVGDDCRQDVLALQVIAMFKNIFASVGLTVYLYPYRVTATAPGCGVIDVVPNATSRDEMGRAKVNDLLDFFVAKYGGEDTVEFQRARLNFIQSMAAYSVACYILQIKDRHNGNIMIDGEGHIVHIADALSGVKFEPNSFKLTHEMVVLMGGRYSQGYQLFQQLTVKAFLAIRPHADQLVSTVQLMLDTGLPSFKGEPTIKRLKDRFALGLTERQAAEWMMKIIKDAHENVRSTVYDEFQRVQNGEQNIANASDSIADESNLSRHTVQCQRFELSMKRYSVSLRRRPPLVCIHLPSMLAARFFIVRHGETDANRQGIIQGQIDTELNAAGWEQAELTAQALENVPFNVAYTSDLHRASKTAEVILAKHPDVPLHESKELRERYFGSLQGKSLSEITGTAADVESIADFSTRALRWWNKAVQRHVVSRKTLPDTVTPVNVLVTAHGGLITVLVDSLLGSRKLKCSEGVKVGKCLNASITVIDVDEHGKGELVSYADTTHLDEDMVEVNADTNVGG